MTPTSATSFPAVDSGSYRPGHLPGGRAGAVEPVRTSTVTGTASYTWPGKTTQRLSVPEQVTTSPPVQAPYKTFSSATDAPAVFGQSGQQFGISGAGADLYTGTDAYSTIYPRARSVRRRRSTPRSPRSGT